MLKADSHCMLECQRVCLYADIGLFTAQASRQARLLESMCQVSVPASGTKMSVSCMVFAAQLGGLDAGGTANFRVPVVYVEPWSHAM